MGESGNILDHVCMGESGSGSGIYKEKDPAMMKTTAKTYLADGKKTHFRHLPHRRNPDMGWRATLQPICPQIHRNHRNEADQARPDEAERRQRKRESRRREKTWSEEKRLLDDGFCNLLTSSEFIRFSDVSRRKRKINRWD
ncbi:hypothetical protein TNCT_493671 [Trichonephila clavata]|uniref:Uncharacterized protein n=1 Tax=Trichonephila clavata TaxID=2740835 RepID=A0A8X6GPG5_TRICU|nr:hypothetical protein TNCT_493671 [Trichonephila clavata]